MDNRYFVTAYIVRLSFTKIFTKTIPLQPTDTADFSMPYVILNRVTYFSTKMTYTSLEV